MVAKTAIKDNFVAILLDINPPHDPEIKKFINNKKAYFYKCDVTDPLQLRSCLNKINDEISVAIHAAYPKSKGFGTRFEDLKFENLTSDLSLQLGSAIIFSQQIMKLFLKQGKGNLIHLSSIQGFSTPKFEHYENTDMVSPIEYSAIKAGIISITRYLAKYYRGKGVRINCISPGGILHNQPSSFLTKYRQTCNHKGMLDSNDLSGIVSFLISEQSKTITGQNFIIDDGWSL